MGQAVVGPEIGRVSTSGTHAHSRTQVGEHSELFLDIKRVSSDVTLLMYTHKEPTFYTVHSCQCCHPGTITQASYTHRYL